MECIKLTKVIIILMKELMLKIISPNFSLKDYMLKAKYDQLKRLIKISESRKKIKKLYLFGQKEYFMNHIYKTLFYIKIYL